MGLNLFSPGIFFLREIPEVFKKLPILYIVLPLVSGCGYYFIHSWLFIGIFAVLAITLARYSPRGVLFSFLILCLWTGYLHLSYAKSETLNLPTGLEGHITLIRTKFPYGLHFKTDRQNWLVEFQDSSWLSTQSPGNTVRLYGPQKKEIEALRNPGEFDRNAFLKSKNIAGILTVDSASFISGPGLYWRVINSSKNWLEKQLENSIHPHYLPLLKACFLGDRSFLSQDTKKEFSQSGMYHLLAISGMHIGIISMVLLKLLWLVRIPKQPAYVAICLSLIFYIFISGQSPSVIRAGTMFAFSVPANLTGKKSSSLNSFLLALGLCLIFLPYQIQSPGLLLSFTATFFLIYYLGKNSSLKPSNGVWAEILKGLLATIKLSFLLTLATYPLCAGYFHQITPMAIMGNCLTLILMSGLMLSACLALIISPIFPPAAAIFGEASGLFANWLLGSVQYISNLKGSHFYMEPPHIISCIGLYLLLLCWPLRKKHYYKHIITLSLLTLSGSFAFTHIHKFISKEVRVSFLDVGQGDAVFLELPGPYRVLIDAGKGDEKSGNGKKVILPFLKERGIQQIDLAVITHSDLDHYGGFLYLTSEIEIKKVAQSFYPNQNPTWNQLNSHFLETNTPIIYPLCTDTLYRYEDIILKTESPCIPEEFAGKNNNSLVLQLYHPSGNILLTGDIEQEAEKSLSQREWDSVYILKLAHHGSKTSSLPDFLSKLAPQIGIISAGRKNAYGFPHLPTLNTLNQLDTRVLSTQHLGFIEFNTSKFSTSWEESSSITAVLKEYTPVDYYTHK